MDLILHFRSRSAHDAKTGYAPRGLKRDTPPQNYLPRSRLLQVCRLLIMSNVKPSSSASSVGQLHLQPPKLDYYEKLKSHIASKKEKLSAYARDAYSKPYSSEHKSDKYSPVASGKERERSTPKASPSSKDKSASSHKKSSTASSSSTGLSTSLSSSLASLTGGSLTAGMGMPYMPYPYLHPGLMPGSMPSTSLSTAALTSPMLYSSLYGLYPNLAASLGASGLSADSMASLLSTSAAGLDSTATITSLSSTFGQPVDVPNQEGQAVKVVEQVKKSTS